MGEQNAPDQFFSCEIMAVDADDTVSLYCGGRILHK